MAERCGCENQGDEIVFGTLHKCRPKPDASQQVERPFERVLSPDELED